MSESGLSVPWSPPGDYVGLLWHNPRERLLPSIRMTARNERGGCEMANRIICSIGITFLLSIVAMVILAFIDGAFSTSLANTRWFTTLIGWAIFFFAFFVIMRPKKKGQKSETETT